MSTHLCSLYHVKWVPHTRNDDLCIKHIVFVYLYYLTGNSHAGMTYIVKPPNKRTHISCACLCSKQGLAWRKDQGHICFDTHARKPFYCPQSFLNHRNFYYNIFVNFGERFCFLDHLICSHAHRLCTHRPIDNPPDFFKKCNRVSPLLVFEGGVFCT